MFFKNKKAVILIATSALLATSLGGNIALADGTDQTNNVSASSTDVSANNTTTADGVTPSKSSDSATSSAIASSQSYNNIDVASVRVAMLSELNRLRVQNGLSALTSVDVLNNYAQSRTNSIANVGNVDNHAGWDSSNMAPYNLTAEENISQMPFFMIGTTDPATIAQKITEEFYNEKYDPEPNYGHRKNMLNPYVNYVGIGISIGNNGMIYASQEMGNDQAAYDKYDPNDIYAYYLTKYNDYANPSKYDAVDSTKSNDDYKTRNDYSTVNMRGGITTKNKLTPVYDRYGNERNDLELSPNSNWLSDVIATIDGKDYYHVCNNGFVAASDALPWASFLSGYKITAATNAKIYDNNGIYTGHNVSANSHWIADRRATNPLNQNKMYRIGTNTWLQQDQVIRK